MLLAIVRYICAVLAVSAKHIDRYAAFGLEVIFQFEMSSLQPHEGRKTSNWRSMRDPYRISKLRFFLLLNCAYCCSHIPLSTHTILPLRSFFFAYLITSCVAIQQYSYICRPLAPEFPNRFFGGFSLVAEAFAKQKTCNLKFAFVRWHKSDTH